MPGRFCETQGNPDGKSRSESLMLDTVIFVIRPRSFVQKGKLFYIPSSVYINLLKKKEARVYLIR